MRERWQNHLDPQLSKEPWEEAEDQLLISLQAVMGNKWSEIARAFQGRSENSVKNRWNSKQRKSLAAERKLRTGSELGVFVPRFLEEIAQNKPKQPTKSHKVAGQYGQNALSPSSNVGIKIDFGKALKAANSPHITTGAEFRRRPQPKTTPSHPKDVPYNLATLTAAADAAEAGESDIKEAGAVLMDILRN